MSKSKQFLVNLLLAAALVFGITFVGVNPEMVGAQGGVSTFATLKANNFYRAQPRTAITVTNGGAIDATGTYQKLTAAAAVGTSGDAVVVEPAGTILILVNSGAQTITITETANIKSAGNIVLGTLDSATLISDGSDWYQVAASNN